MKSILSFFSSFVILHLPRVARPLGGIGFALMLAVPVAPRLSFAVQPLPTGETSAAAYPIAKVLLNPGADYDDSSRSWQGIPGIERAPKGRLWATWYSGDLAEGDVGNYALVVSSGNDGRTWSKLLIIQGPEGTKIGDPLPWLDAKGRLWIFWAQVSFSDREKSKTGFRGTFAIRTDTPDSAAPAWTEPMLIAEGGILFGKPLVRGDGGWVAPFFLMGRTSWSDQTDGKETGTLLSTDEGETWNWLGGTSIPQDLRNFSEATLAPRQDGSLWMVIRTQRGLYESSSFDQGKTWSEAVPLAKFEGPATRACLRRLDSGAFLLVYHDATRSKSGSYPRQRLTAWLSEDEGRTWPHQLLLDERGSVSYPDVTQAPDGRLYVAYDYGRYNAGEKQVLLSVIREEDIRAGRVVSSDAKLKRLVNRALGYGNYTDLKNESETAASLPPPEQLHVYLLIGQSNMAGRGELDTAQRLSRLRVLKFSPNNAWTIGVEPLHHDKPAVVGAGLGMSFARQMADADPRITVGLVPCAVGGTPLERWEKNGDLYNQALERARLALRHGTLKGILWHQGEGDSGTEAKARSYADRLAQMIADLRADLGAGEVPFVAGKLGEFLSPQTRDGKPSFWPVVNEQLASLPARVPNSAVVESTGLQHKGDQVHFDTPSLREFGKRYAAAMQGLQQSK